MIEMSIDISIQLLNKLVASASCPSCGHCYDQPKLAICGHRICPVCCKTKNNCLTCEADVDSNLLKEEILMVKLVKAIKHNLQMFMNLHSSEDVNKKFKLGNGWSDTCVQDSVQVERWLDSSQNCFSIPPTQNQEPLLHIVEPRQPNHKKILHKSAQQHDFDKIECIEESQPYFIKEKENVIGPFDIENFKINHTERNVSLRRSTRGTLQKSEIVKQTSNTLVTEAIVEDHVIAKVNDTVSETRCTSNKSMPKQKNWKSVKRMKKEFEKLNKPDIKKLSISMEMCKKTQSIISKPNISNDVKYTDPMYTIEDDTPRVLSPPQPNQHNGSNSVQAVSIQACGKHNAKSSSPIKVGERIIYDSNRPKEVLMGITQEMPTLNSVSDLSSQVLVSTQISKSTQRNYIISNTVVGTSKINMNNNPQSQICQISQKNKNELRIHEKGVQRVNSSGKRKFPSLHSREKACLIKQSANKGKPCKQYKRRHEKRVGILNITTPEGKFIITGENICVIKQVIHCNEKSTQTDHERSCFGKRVTVEDKNDDVGDSMLLPSVNLTEKDETSSLLNKMSKNTGKTMKTNTASVDTATAPLKITEDILDVEEESDIFNTCSGVNKPQQIPIEISHSEMVGDLTQISQRLTQRAKRQLQNTDEPLRKKAKSHNSECPTNATKPKSNEAVHVLHSQNQNSVSISVEVTQKPSSNITNEFDEITSKAFAQIDADLYEHKKNKDQAETSQEIEHSQKNVAFNTPKSTQNKVFDIDSDGIEDTPQKEKPPLKRISTNHNTESTTSENLKACTVDTGAALPKQTKDGTTEIQDIQSPLSMHFSPGITNESTPLRTVPRRSLDFSRLQTQNAQENVVCPDTLSYQNNGACDVAKTTLEKEFMEKAFEKTTIIAPPKRQVSLRLPRDDRHIQVACSCLSHDEKMEVIKFTKKHKLEFVETYTPQLTHLIVGVDGRKAQRTVKYVHALAGGKWILSFEWISECIKNNRIVNEAPYEVLDMTGDNGPELSRLAKTKLFEGMIFYCHPPFNMLQRQELEAILKTAGGRVAKNIEEVSWNLKNNISTVSMAIMEPQSTLDHEYTCLSIEKAVIPVNFEWAFNCLGSYSLQPLMLLCSWSLIPVGRLNWPHKLFDTSDSNDQIETQ